MSVPHVDLPIKEVVLITSGDLRQSANEVCWPAQEELERRLTQCFAYEGVVVKRAFPVDPAVGHGFISSQRMGMDIFSGIDPDANLVFATAAWQYSHHVLPGMRSHRGPMLTVANWSGQWPGLVGLLNLNGSLIKAGVKFNSLWSENFTDDYFLRGIREWIKRGSVTHDLSHVRDLDAHALPAKAASMGKQLAAALQKRKGILGVFDEGCMGMYNAIVDDELLNAAGIFKERLSQSALVARMRTVSDEDAKGVRQWLDAKGLRFVTGKDEKAELTDGQIHEQCKMYIAAVRMADEFGCDAIGIQYQQGLKDLLPASDLVEGTLNDADRPPVTSRDGARVLYENQPLPHFNEVDECAGLDGLMTFRVHHAMGQPVENTLHDLRWGDMDRSGTVLDYVWVFLISGSAPPAHFIDGWAGASSERQPPMYFRLGGGTLKGVSKPGEIVWSRVFVDDGRLRMDLGRGGVVALPGEETQRRWDATTPQWPIMHAVTYGVSRDQMMARHKANHIQVAYANTPEDADRAMLAKAAFADALGIDVSICGTKKNGKGWD